jgi:hypothetical protein
MFLVLKKNTEDPSLQGESLLMALPLAGGREQSLKVEERILKRY